ncbi:MAG: DUF711 family protein [Prevotellaceae bacterium]|jgi:uncharacterized protein (UPF0210 family)|nr:DUF711 family protein [Prevotellaceae bacterium]
MIGIRAVTYHLPHKFLLEHITSLAPAIMAWEQCLFPVRTSRVNLPPIAAPIENSKMQRIASACYQVAARWFNVPVDPHLSEDKGQKLLFSHAFSILNDFPHAFVHIIAVKNNEINCDILAHSAQLIQNVSAISHNGADNFRLGISANVLPDGPFFPFTMSSGDYSFSIALELTQEINRLLLSKDVAKLTFPLLKKHIIAHLRPQIAKINDMAEAIAQKCGLTFKGFDFSLAPIIEEHGSVLPILNAIGLTYLGASGSMFATAFLTDLLKSFGQYFKMVGFSGVMYSVLEDLELCTCNNNNGVSIEQLTAVSTMCGCGVDMVPVYGGITVEELFAVFLDITAISCRLKKPLGIRILPIPRTHNHQEHYTLFSDDADFISNTKIVPVNNSYNIQNKNKNNNNIIKINYPNE